MKNRLLRVTFIFAVLLISMAAAFLLMGDEKEDNDRIREIRVALNEIAQLSDEAASTGDAASFGMLENKIAELQDKLAAEGMTDDGSGKKDDSVTSAESDDSAESMKRRDIVSAVFLVSICIIFLAGVFLYVYIYILRPFEKMEKYAEAVASGNFDLPLEYERANYFGAFTWAFDMMRREITKARACEREAIENNKTVIATLSHDIKTPIASVRAYAEALEANMDSSPEKRARYTGIIIRKCDEVAKLTNDLFLHSLSDMNKLQVSLEELDLTGLLEEVVKDAPENHVDLIKPNEPMMAAVDRKRFIQVIENLLNNADKYAKTNIDICLTKEADNAVMTVRDYGTGIPDEDLPFIFDKFYRGRNCGTEQGSGLGLYISKYIILQMNGELMLQNREKGLEIKITLPSIRIS